MQKKRILFITNSLGFGGAEKMITFISGELAARGHICVIVNLNGTAKYVDQYRREIDSGISVYELHVPERENRHKYYISELVKIGKKERADVLVAFTSYPNMYAKIVGTLLGIPSIMSERGDPARTSSGSISAKIMHHIVNASRGGVFQTDGAKAFYGKGLQKRGIVIPNPIFVKGEIPNIPYEEREKSVVSVGRLDNFQKRYDIMLQAFRLFAQTHPDYVLKLYGTGDDEEQIKAWVLELGLQDKVRFMGLTHQPMRDIAKDGMFLITSDFEGISNALLEAMAVGLPCVSTDHTPGGARLLIQDHENGLLAPIGDAEKLAIAMGEFADDPALAQRCGEKAKEVTSRFAPERIIDMWEQYIAKICK